MFPFDVEEKEQEEEELVEPKEYEIDFTTGQLTGQIVTGYEAVKTWAWLALHTERYEFLQYSWDYGREFEHLIGKSYDKEYLNAEAERILTDCLLVNPWITGVESVNCEVEEDKVVLHFRLITEYGEGEIDV